MDFESIVVYFLLFVNLKSIAKTKEHNKEVNIIISCESIRSSLNSMQKDTLKAIAGPKRTLEIIYYSKNKELSLISIFSCDSLTRNDINLFIENNKLIFAQDKEIKFW